MNNTEERRKDTNKKRDSTAERYLGGNKEKQTRGRE